jgi:hypothetical protein
MAQTAQDNKSELNRLNKLKDLTEKNINRIIKYNNIINMKFVFIALLASAQALRIRDDKPAVAKTYNEFSERVPNLPGFNNDEVLATEMV